jgi:hypothetical protein
MADGIAETSADIFNRIKISIGDGPENDPNAVTLHGEVEEYDPDAVNLEGGVEENDPSDSGGFVEFIIGTDDIDFQVYYPRVDSYDFMTEQGELEAEIGSGSFHENIQDGVETGDQSGDSVIMEEEEMSDNTPSRSLSGSQQADDEAMADPNPVEEDFDDGSIDSQGEGMTEGPPADVSMADSDSVTEETANEDPDAVSLAAPSEEDEEGENSDYSSDYSSDESDDDSDYVDDPKGKKSHKGKNKASPESRYETYNLCDMIMDEEKPDGPPTHYICKVAGCNGFRGK